MSSWKKFFTPHDNSGLPLNVQGNHADGGMGSASSQVESWLPQLYVGSPNRMMRYQQYDGMDTDAIINAALDTIAEFGTQQEEVSKLPFVIEYDGEHSDSMGKILDTSLKKWCALNKMNRRVFKIFRQTIKYGDQIFIRDPETYELYWVDPMNVEVVEVNEAEGKDIVAYYIKDLEPIFEQLVATDASNQHYRAFGSGQGTTGIMSPTAMSSGGAGTIEGANSGSRVPAEHIVHISLTEGMDQAWPFGLSILDPIFKVFKQKELLEDSIIIYRVHRAPERRVFFIDVGNMPPHRAKQYIEQVKLEVQQKRVPGKNSQGQSIADSSYNPMSMLEDYFFAQTADGRGSKVDTLAGGDNLGQIDDLKYFNNLLMRGLKIPSSYLPTGPEDGTATYNDGKVGVAYIQEFRFAKYVSRLQKQIEDSLDREFKMYLKKRGIEIDNADFHIEFTEPMNFSSYRDIQLMGEQAGLYAQVAGISHLSEQFKLKRFLGLSDTEMRENESLWKEENAVKVNDPLDDSTMPGIGAAGLRPEPNDVVDFGEEPNLTDMEDGGDFGGGDMFDGPDPDLGGEPQA